MRVFAFLSYTENRELVYLYFLWFIPLCRRYYNAIIYLLRIYYETSLLFRCLNHFTWAKTNFLQFWLNFMHMNCMKSGSYITSMGLNCIQCVVVLCNLSTKSFQIMIHNDFALCLMFNIPYFVYGLWKDEIFISSFLNIRWKSVQKRFGRLYHPLVLFIWSRYAIIIIIPASRYPGPRTGKMFSYLNNIHWCGIIKAKSSLLTSMATILWNLKWTKNGRIRSELATFSIDLTA